MNATTDASMLTVVATLFTAGIGLSVTLVVWLLGRSAAAVPSENREYKDAPPLGFRLIWWPVRWIGHYVQPLLPDRFHQALASRLRRAGLEYSLTPAEFMAGRVLGAVAAGLLIAALLRSWNFSSAFTVQAALLAALFGGVYPSIWLRDRIALRRRELLKALPFFLDLITLCMEAGLNLQGAIGQAVAKGPDTPLRDEFQRVLRDVRAGKPRAESLRTMADRLEETNVTTFVSAVIQAENMGMNLAPVLRAQADQRRTERFLRAEKQAMEAPVKMLFPLIAFIFPCTFIVLLFPIAMELMEAGF